VFYISSVETGVMLQYFHVIVTG